MQTRLLLTLCILILCSCSSINTLQYEYLPTGKYQFLAPIKPIDLKSKRFQVEISDGRFSSHVSCSDITLVENKELDGDFGLSYFSFYTQAMIEANNGIVDMTSHNVLEIKLKALSMRRFGFGFRRIWGIVEFNVLLDGVKKTYCIALGDGDPGAPLGKSSFTTIEAGSRLMVAGAVRHALESFIHDLK